MQVGGWPRMGLRRPPVATAAVFVVTAAVSVLGLVRPEVLAALQRTRRGSTATGGGASRPCSCRTAGSPAPSPTSPSCWSWASWPSRCWGRGGGWSATSGRAGRRAAGYAWQQRGAGNSVAICGLAGALILALLAEAPVPRLAPVVLLYWCAALLAAHWGPALLLFVAAGVATQVALARGLRVGRLAGVAAALAALVLLAARDLHGAAMVAGIAIGAAVGRAP